MLSKKIEKSLNQQIELETFSSQLYLSMASWAETHGLNGTSQFLYKHADEERTHALKLMHFINERGAYAIVSTIKQPQTKFKSLKSVFEQLLEHELMITQKINNLVALCLEEKDYTTHNFLQWYVSEQLEEEALARTILDRLKLIGDDKGGLYLFDRDIESIVVTSAAAGNA